MFNKTPSRFAFHPSRLFPLGVVLVAYALRVWHLDLLALIGDESYYWLWSRNLDCAYYDHPAGTALLVRASTVLGGGSAFGVRWLNAWLGVIAVSLTAFVGHRLLSRRAGWFGAAAVALGAPYLITSRFVYTDALHLVLLLSNLLAFWRLLQDDAGFVEALIFGGTLALLFNTKYSAYFYAVALALAVLLDHRTLLRERRLWIGGTVAAVGLLPVFAWNATRDWASFRWQLSHATLTLAERPSLLGSAHHAWVYLTWPLVVLGGLGLGRWQRPAERLLTLVALCMLAPVAISPANSPRNLSTGLVPLLLLAGSRLPAQLRGRMRRAGAILLTLGVLGVALYGVGTVVNLAGPSPLPHSSIVPAILRDAAGWRRLGPLLAETPGPFFALDYSVAAQIRYYARRPATTAWGQYRIWGFPDLEDVTVVALDYLPAPWVTRRLQEAFTVVEGPQRLTLMERGATKVVHIWRAEGLQWGTETFLRHFDFLALVEAAP
jgi:4-amino-4-deoxy-L-arabinose transferase-like glycosyltransferase